MLSLILLLAADPVAAAVPAAPAVAEASCQMVVEKDGQRGLQPAAGLKVLGGPDTVTVPLPAGGKLLGVMCHRASIVPDAGDDRVFRQLGVPLYITTGPMTASLKVVDGAFAYRAVSGAWDESVQPQIDAVLATFNARLGG